MSLDLVQYIFMATCAPLAIATILWSISFSVPQRMAIGFILVAWFLLTAWTAIPSLGKLPGALFGIIFPVVLVSFFLIYSKTAARLINQMAVAPLVLLHVTRLAGGLFILLHAEGRLSDPFASIAGWGDILAATLAVPAANIAYRAKPGWQNWVLAWNVIGFADFISAITLGATSQVGNILQVFSEPPGTAVLGSLPWRFIPSYFVPLYMMIHVALFIRLLPARKPVNKSFASS
jgi:hypothetical protein